MVVLTSCNGLALAFDSSVKSSMVALGPRIISKLAPNSPWRALVTAQAGRQLAAWS